MQAKFDHEARHSTVNRFIEYLRNLMARKKQTIQLGVFALLKVRLYMAMRGDKTRVEILRRIAKLNCVMTRFNDKNLSAPSIGLRRAFFRWLVRSNSSMAKECLEKMVLSVSIKKEISVWRLFKLRDTEFVRRKAKFLEFVEKLVELTDRANAKMIHSYKNLFFFSLLLISAKKEREDFNKKLFSFVKTVNGKLGQKTSSIFGSITAKNPKQTLFSILHKSAQKKEQESLARMQLLAKKGRLLATYKFVDLVNSRIGLKTSEIFDETVSMRRKLVTIFVSKARISLRRLFKQLVNKSLFLLNQKEGVGKFVKILEQLNLHIGLRKAFKGIQVTANAKKRAKQLDKQMTQIAAVQSASLLRNSFLLLREKVAIIVKNKRQAVARQLIKSIKLKTKKAFLRMQDYCLKKKQMIAFIAKSLSTVRKESLATGFGILRVINISAKCSHQRNTKLTKTALNLNRLVFARRSKLRQSLQTLQRFNRNLIRRLTRISGLMKTLILSVIQPAFTRIRLHKHIKTSQASLYFKNADLLPAKIARLQLRNLTLAFSKLKSLWSRAKSASSSLVKITAKKLHDNKQSVFVQLHYITLGQRLINAKQQVQSQIKDLLFKRLVGHSRLALRIYLQRLLAFKNRRQAAQALLLKTLNLKSRQILQIYLGYLQRNRVFTTVMSDQDRRKILLIRILQSLSKIESKRKSDFLRLLQKFHQKVVIGRQLIKKLAENKYRLLMGSSFSKLVNHYRRNKMTEFSTLIDKTTTDLSDFNRVFRPKYNQMVLKSMVESKTVPRSNRLLANALRVLRSINDKAAAARKTIVKFLLVRLTGLKQKSLQQLKEHAAIRKANLFELNLKLWTLNKFIAAKKRQSLSNALGRIKRLRDFLERFGKMLNNHLSSDRKQKLMSSFSALVKFSEIRKISDELTIGTKKSAGLLHCLSRLFDRKQSDNLRSLLSILQQNQIKRIKVRNGLLVAYKIMAKNTLRRLIAFCKQKVAEENRERYKSKLRDQTVSRLVSAINQKQSNALNSLVNSVAKDQINSARINFWNRITRQIRSRILKDLFKVAQTHSLLISKNRKIETVFKQMALNAGFCKSKCILSLRLHSSKHKIFIRRILARLSGVSTKKKAICFNSLTLFLLNAKDRILRLQKLSLAIDSAFRLKLVRLGKVFFARINLMKSSPAIRKMTESSITKMNFRKKAGEFLEKLDENQVVTKSKSRTLSKLHSSAVSKLLWILKTFSNLNAQSKVKLSRLGLTLCAPLIAKTKAKQRFVLYRLMSRLKGFNRGSNVMSMLMASLKSKQSLTYFYLKHFALSRRTTKRVAGLSLTGKLRGASLLKVSQAFSSLARSVHGDKASRPKLAIWKLVTQSQLKKHAVFRRLRNPDFRLHQKENCIRKLIRIKDNNKIQGQKDFLVKISKFSPLFVYRKWATEFSRLNKLFKKQLTLGFVLIMRRVGPRRGLRFWQPAEKLAAARFIVRFIARRNLSNEKELLHPCLLLLINNGLPNKLDEVDKKQLEVFQQLITGPSDSIMANKVEEILKRDELKEMNLIVQEDKNGLMIGNTLLIEQAKLLKAENDRLEAERTHMTKNQQDLEGILSNYQEKLAQLQSDVDNRASEVMTQQKEKDRLEEERRQLEQGLLISQVINSDDNFDSRTSRVSYEAGQEFKSRISRLQKEKKELENLLTKYKDETKNMEEEMNRFEKEEFDFIQKISSLQGDHLTIQQQLLENEGLQQKLREENKQLRMDNTAIIGQIETLTQETKSIMEQLRNLEEEGRIVADREMALKEENTSLVRQNQTLVDENAVLLATQQALLQERDELLQKNSDLTAQAEELKLQKEKLIEEKQVLMDTEVLLRKQIMTRNESKKQLMQDNAFLLSQRSIQLDDQEALLKEVNNQKGSRKKSLVANERLGSIFLKLKVIDDNINQNNQQIYTEEKEIQRAEGELMQATSNLAQTEWQIKKLDERLDQVQNVLADNIMKVDKLTEKIEQSSGKITRNNTQIETNGKLITENKALLDEIEQTLHELRVQEEDGSNAVKNKRNEIQNLNYKLEQNSGVILKNQKDESKVQDTQFDLDKKLQASESKIREIEAKKEELASKIAALMAESQNIGSKEKMTSSVISEKAVQLESIAEFMNEDDIEPLDPSNFESRQDITKRMSDLRENLEKVSKTLEEKKALLNNSEKKFYRTQHKIDDQKKIASQTSSKISDIQRQIEQNLRSINQQTSQLQKNEEELKRKEEMIIKNNEEIKHLNEKLKAAEAALAPPPQNFKKLVSKKIQTFMLETSENRCQTEICYFDITNLEKMAAQRHIVKTIEQPVPVQKIDKGTLTKDKKEVEPPKKEVRKSVLVEEAIAPIIRRVRQMQREPSMRKDLPLAAPDDPMNLPYLKQDKRLDKLDKLYEFKVEAAEDPRDIIGILKKNPFMKIELYFDSSIPEKKPKAKKNVEDISGYFLKAGERKSPITKEYKDILVNTEGDLPDFPDKSQISSVDIPFLERPRIETVMTIGPSFTHRKTLQSIPDLQDVFEFLFPKTEAKFIPPMPSIKEFITIDNKIKEVQTYGTQTEFEPAAMISFMKIVNVFGSRDNNDLQYAFRLISTYNMLPVKPHVDLEIVPIKRLFNNKKVQIQFQLKALKQKKNENTAKFVELFETLFVKKLGVHFHHLKLIANMDMCKMYLNSLFRWKLQNVQFNQKKQLDHIKSLRMGLDSIFTHLVFKRLSFGFRQIQRYQDMRIKGVYRKLLPILFKGDQTYKNTMRNVIRYWSTIKDENRWFTKIIREMVNKSSLEPQIALWKLKIFRKPVKVIPPKVFAGVTRLVKFFTKKNAKMIKEVSNELTKFIVIPSPDSELSIDRNPDIYFSESGEVENSQEDEDLSRANAKLLVLSVKTIFRTLQDRWNVRICSSFIKLRNLAQSYNQSTPKPKHSAIGIEANQSLDDVSAKFLLDENVKCKKEMERKDKMITELRSTLEYSRTDLLFLKNSFLYVVLNRIQYLINKHNRETAEHEKRRFLRLLQHY